MDKFEYKVRADEIKELISEGNYAEAAEIADTIDWRRVKSVMMLCMISDLYKINKRYDDAKNMLLLAYDRRPGGRTICYSLCELCLKTREFVQAVNYYNEFMQVAPNDPGRFILKYKILEAQEGGLEERIQILEELKAADYREKWAYELAYLHHRIGNASQCVDECDELILWFGEGKYVYKAMELKMRHCPLTPGQQEKYDHRFDQPVKEVAVPEPVQEAVAVARVVTPEEAAADMTAVEAQASRPEELQSAVSRATGEILYARDVESQVADETKVIAELPLEQTVAEAAPEEEEIHVKTMDVSEYNTINLQAELAAGLQSILGEEKASAPDERTAAESVSHGADVQDEEIESTEVFFGETGEISRVRPSDLQGMCEIILPEEEPAAEQSVVEEFVAEETVEPEGDAEDVTAQIVMEQMRMEGTGEAVRQVMTAEPPKALAGVLSQESDGQIRLVIPERESVEKQITGQMNIEDILAEWERMKQETEEKRKEEVRRHVLQQTGTMFTEFEASIRDGLLEKLESGEAGSVDELLAQEALDGSTDEAPEQDDTADASEMDAEDLEAIFEDVNAEDIAEVEKIVEEAEEFSADEEEFVADVEAADEEPAEESIVEFEAADEEPAEESIVEFEEADEDPAEDPIADVEEADEEPAEDTNPVETEESKESSGQEVAERPRVRSLTREERELYAPFIQGRNARENLVKAIDAISLAAYTGNIIVTGEEGMDTMLLAKNMMREVQISDSNFSGKVAKVSGEGLNNRDVEETVKSMSNGGLIIQKASDMNSETAGKLRKLLQKDNFGIIVVLEDTKKGISRLFANNPGLSASFTARMDVEALSNASLAAFGKKYAREMEFAIDDVGMLALHMRIEALQTIDHAVTVTEVKEIVDGAIHNAKKKTLKHFVDILFAKRYDDEDMIILTEKDFA